MGFLAAGSAALQLAFAARVARLEGQRGARVYVRDNGRFVIAE